MIEATLVVLFGLVITGLVTAQNFSLSIDILGPHPNATPDPSGKTASASTQFCRQCHFDKANESNNTQGVTTQFQ